MHGEREANATPRATQELLEKCNPLGMFDSIATLAVASSMRELYRLVLVDTPLAPYFSESLSAGGPCRCWCPFLCHRTCVVAAGLCKCYHNLRHAWILAVAARTVAETAAGTVQRTWTR